MSSAIEATPLLTYPFLGSSIPALSVSSLRLINRDSGPLFFSFRYPFISSSSSRQPRTRAPPSSSNSASASPLSAASNFSHLSSTAPFRYFRHRIKSFPLSFLDPLGFPCSSLFLRFIRAFSVALSRPLGEYFVSDVLLAIANLPSSSQTLMRKELI